MAVSHKLLPKPLFDTLAEMNTHEPIAKGFPIFGQKDFSAAWNFLKQYDGNEATFSSYRREVERLVQWTWFIANKSILQLGREEIEDYIAFCLNPPKAWISLKRASRFIEKDGVRLVNPEWRPFVATVSKSDYKHGASPDKNEYQLSQKSLQEIFTVLSSFYNYLALEGKVTLNPIALIRQKSKYLQKRQKQAAVMRLTEEQWETCLAAAEAMAKEDPPLHERTLFMLTAMYLMYLRISELAGSDRWIPQMNHFYQDSNGDWWFKTVGKGNKMREVAVSDTMLAALKRYRNFLGLSDRPAPNENTPLIEKDKGKGALTSTRHIRRLIQLCFDRAVELLKTKNLKNEAQILETATVHWLRHTGISDDINKRGRPIAHVRDDAGHSSSAITDRYNDIELRARHASARKKTTKQTTPLYNR
jgi:site-specific recombinase XerD